MTARHHTSGRFAPIGRPPKVEVKAPRRNSVKRSAANAAFNAHAAASGTSATNATPGQPVAAGIVRTASRTETQWLRHPTT